MIVAVVPVKALAQGKSRLAPILSQEERGKLMAALVKRTLTILQACQGIQHTVVVTPDPQVGPWANEAGAQVLPEKPAAGQDHLNSALTQGASYAQAAGATGLLVLPADLPFVRPREIESFVDAARSNQMVICPDRHQTGTNALLLTPPSPFVFQYGPHSFQKHISQAQRRERSWCSLSLPGLTFDLDTVTDWQDYRHTLSLVAAIA